MAHNRTREVLQNGTVANDGNGDTLRDAATKINNNFKNVFEVLGDSANLTQFAHFDSDGALIFGDSANGIREMKLVAKVASGVNKVITFPDHTGTVITDSATQTLQNKDIELPKIDMIKDSNSQTILELCADSSSISNRLKIQASDSDILLAVEGDSADVNIHINPMNNGNVHIDGLLVQETETMIAAGKANRKVPMTFVNPGATVGMAISCSDGTVTGQRKTVLNIGTSTGTVALTPSTLNAGTTVTIAKGHGIDMIWHGSAWILLGCDSASQITIT